MSFIKFVHCSWRTQRDRRKENEKKVNLYCLSPWAPSTHVPLHSKLMINLLPYSHCSCSECPYLFICHSSHSNKMAFWYKIVANSYVALYWIARNPVCFCNCLRVREDSGRKWGWREGMRLFCHYINYVAQRVHLLAGVQHPLPKQYSGNNQYLKIYGVGKGVTIVEENFKPT